MGFISQIISGKKRGNYSPNKIITFDLAGKIFSMQIPECALTELSIFDRLNGGNLVDIYKDDLWGAGSELVLAKAGWVYPGLKFFEKSFGEVSVTITVFQRPEGINLFSYDKLMLAITAIYQDKYKNFNDEARKSAVVTDHIPTELFHYYPEDESWFHTRDINSQKWLSFNLVGKETHNVYALPLSDRHFLMVDYHFDYHAKRGDWELKKLGGAADDVEAITNTMKLSYAEKIDRVEKKP